MEKNDLGNFLEEEGLNLQGFDQWLETRDETSQDPDYGRVVSATNPGLLYQLLEGVKGKEEADIIQGDITEGKAFLESSGELLQVIRYSKGTFRAPGPMIKLGEKIYGDS